ncbi:MAG: hypothetical protein OES24_22280, partial [Acidimicrobiia bacterium]|nr:hypothetical protein [Acidimicrobiia bacterium]
LEAELTATREDVDTRQVEATIADLRVRLEAAEAKAALVPERDATIAELRGRLSRADEAAASAPAPAAGTSEKAKTQTAEKPSGKPSWHEGTTKLGTPGADHVDDLKQIRGIGPVMERTLQSFGIQTWEQVAAFTPDDIEKVTAAIDAFPGRIERDDWMGGAQALLDAGHVPGDSKPANAEPARKDSANREKKAKKPSWQKVTTKLGAPGAAHTDDLKVINGIGPVMEKTLQSLGIQTWEQLAALGKADVDKVTAAIDAFPGRIERDEWVRQAADLVKRFPLRSPYDRPTRKTFLNESTAP